MQTPPTANAAAFGSEERLDLITKAIVVAIAHGILTSFRLWAGPRTFPSVPLLPFLPPMPFPLDWLLLAAMVTLLFVIFFTKRPALPITLLLGCLVVELAFDQNRMTPWMYQYFFMLVAIAAGRRAGRRDGGAAEALETCRLIVACMLLWSGIEKVNVRFFMDVVPWLLQPFAHVLGGAAYPLTMLVGLLVPATEIAVGIGLFTKRYRALAAYVGMAFMALTYLYFGPFGRAWNGVIWAWDLAMIFFLAMFVKGEPRAASFRAKIASPAYALAFVLFGVLPAFGVFGRWDAMMSAALYSGNTKTAYAEVSDGLMARFPPRVASLMREVGVDRNKLDLYLWAAAEIHTPPYPETRVFEAVARSICPYADKPDDLTLVIHERPGLFSGRAQITRKDCGTL